jgi:Flp pilus assembly protein protease CpaA
MTTQQIISAIPLAYLLVGAIPVLVINARQSRVPNKFVVPLLFITLATSTTNAVLFGTWANWGIGLLASLFMLIGMTIWHERSGTIGMGDVKLITTGLLIICSVSLLHALIYLGAVVLAFILVWLVMLFVLRDIERLVKVAPVILVIIIGVSSSALFA